MIDTHEKFRMPNLDGKSDWFIEVNWNPKDKKTNECKVLKIIFPDKTTQLMKKEHLNAVLFAIGNAAEQREMIPQVVTKVRKFSKMLQVTATKNIAKGEKMVFPYEFEIPIEQFDRISNLGDIKKDKHHIIGTGTKLPK